MIDIEHYHARVAEWTYATRSQWARPAVLAPCVEVLERTALQLALGAQDLADWAAHQIVLGIELEAPGRYYLARLLSALAGTMASILRSSSARKTLA